MSILSKMDDFAEVVGTAIRNTNLHMDELLEAIADIDNKYATTVDYVVSTPNIDVGDIVAGVTYTLASSAQSLLANDPLDVTFFILTIPELNIMNQACPATDNAFSTTFTIPEDFNKPSIKISLYALDSENHKSETNIKTCQLVEAEVKAPIITSPEEGALLKLNKGIVVTTSAFNATVQDTHDTSSFKITSDALGRNVILNDAQVTDKTSHTFPLYSFDDETFAPDTDYFVHAQHHGALLGSSKWSLPRRFRILDGVVTQNGRYIYRHSSDKGIVIEWELNGVPKKLFVYDELAVGISFLTSSSTARYDSLKAITEYGLKSTSYTEDHGLFKEMWNVFSSGKVAGISSSSVTLNGADSKFLNVGKSVTYNNNQVLDSRVPLKSSRVLCNSWMTYNSSGNPPKLVNYARSIIDIEGIDNLDIPSVRELQVILSESGTDNPKLSKTRDESFFIDKTASKFVTCNTYCYNYQNGSGYGQCMVGYGYNNHAATRAFMAYHGTDYSSFLVRDLTDYTEEQTTEE